jgi:sec-independent protein translocase protein TatC
VSPDPEATGPPTLGPPEGAVASAKLGREPAADEAALEAAERARQDRAEAATRRDPDLARAGGGAADHADLADEEPLDGDGDGPSLRMSLLEHLEELRVRLIRSVLAIVVGAAAGWWFSAWVLEWAIRHTVGHVVVLDPLESFGERFKLALILGGCVALPLVLYQVWAFVLPGLYRRERRMMLPLVFGSLVLFFTGAGVAIFMIVPLVLQVLQTFLTPGMRQDIRLSSLLGFVYNLALATGVVFQLPLVAGALTFLRLLSARFLVRQWRLAIVGTLIISAAITPGDVATAQIVLGIPLALLYLLSIGVSWLVERLR